MPYRAYQIFMIVWLSSMPSIWAKFSRWYCNHLYARLYV